MKNAMTVIYIRWAGPKFEQGYEIFDRPNNEWLPVSKENVALFLHGGGIVHMNPEYIPRDNA